MGNMFNFVFKRPLWGLPGEETGGTKDGGGFSQGGANRDREK